MKTATKKPDYVSVICNNPRFYCLSRSWTKTMKPCECGAERFDIGSIEGARLKALKKNKGRVFSAHGVGRTAGRGNKYAEGVE